MPRHVLTATVLVSALALSACASKPKELPPQPTATTTTTTAPTGPQMTGPAPGSQADFLASVLSDTVHFDTDRYNIDTEDQGVLQKIGRAHV